ncbi:MAG: AI-2E family transporter [Gammaproteobacteria bacterium]|nr:MAG: AI-2E family transporter [Gammaproteobacteria bacterium]
MINIVKTWIDKYFSDEQAVILFFLLVASVVVIVSFGAIMAPVIASIVIAFILQGLVTKLIRLGLKEPYSIQLTFLLFIGVFSLCIFALFPLVWGQVAALVKEIPRMFTDFQEVIRLLPEKNPQLFSEQLINQALSQIANEGAKYGQLVVSVSLRSIPNVVAIMIYLVLVPILVFFFLKDRAVILQSLATILPRDRRLMNAIWLEMNVQFANYIRGKVLEIAVVGGVTYICFIVFGLNYAALLAFLVGLSVVIPYIGAAVVTIPVALIAFFQFGWGSEFVYLMLAYGIIQALDGNVLVPLLFSEVVNLHPVLIIVAVLFFGGVWGFWGVFFAIPLATLVKAILIAWPTAGSHAK